MSLTQLSNDNEEEEEEKEKGKKKKKKIIKSTKKIKEILSYKKI